MKNSAIDWIKYGALVKGERTKRFIRTAEQLSREVERRTGETIGRDAIYRIEQGKQTPTVAQFFAINITLFGELLPESNKDVEACFSREWREYYGSKGVPESRQRENLEEMFGLYGVEVDGGNIAIYESDITLDDEEYEAAIEYLPEKLKITKEGKFFGFAFAKADEGMYICRESDYEDRPMSDKELIDLLTMARDSGLFQGIQH